MPLCPYCCETGEVEQTTEPDENNQAEFHCLICGEYFVDAAEHPDATDPCPYCGGRGTVRNDGFVWVKCPACKGS